ncbi:MAG: hypothetical protein BMS9Abin23_0317 [Thermodesulfobacteriota bacterium]|nr:MAG: hypothetical protein BMS9Abin23_0317 [Thermodesulfobacteriota bacterium]
MGLKRGFKILLAVLSIVLLSYSAQAAPIEGNSTGIFTNPSGPGTMVTTGVGTDTFTWGTGAHGGPSSSLNFTGNTIATDFNTLFSFGTLNYFNGTIYSGTQADNVDLLISLNLTSPTGLSENFNYSLNLINTLNVGVPAIDADYVVFPTVFPGTSFTLGDTEYTLAFSGFGSITSGGFASMNEFHVYEGSTASAELIGTITTRTAVPEPSTLLLFGSALVGLAFLRRKFSA